MRAHLAFLLAPHLTEGVLLALQVVVSGFETHGYALPLRDGVAPAEVDRTIPALRSLNSRAATRSGLREDQAAIGRDEV